MIYIVSGDGPRCGSSMMMQALIAGGMEAVYDPCSDDLAEAMSSDDYVANPGGRYELLSSAASNIGFPSLELYDGKVIKLFPRPWGQIPHVVAGEYRIIWMHRLPSFRWRSFFKAHAKCNHLTNMFKHETIQRDMRDLSGLEALEIIKVRRDIATYEVKYDDVVAQPTEVFEFLAKHGWPIDAAKAAKIPDRSLNRMGSAQSRRTAA